MIRKLIFLSAIALCSNSLIAQKITSDNLADIILQQGSSTNIDELLAFLGEDVTVTKYPGVWSIISLSKGLFIDLHSGTESLKSINFSGMNNFAGLQIEPFTGRLPRGITFTSSREQIADRLGISEAERVKFVNNKKNVWISRFEDFKIQLTFDESNLALKNVDVECLKENPYPKRSKRLHFLLQKNGLNSEFTEKASTAASNNNPANLSADKSLPQTQSTSASDSFISEVNAIMKQRSDAFESIKGAQRSKSIFETGKKVSGVKDCYIQKEQGVSTFVILIGDYADCFEAKSKYAEILEQLKTGMSDKLFLPDRMSGKTSKSTTIADKFADGYHLDGDKLVQILGENGGCRVEMHITKAIFPPRRVYHIPAASGSGDATFDSNLKKIIEAGSNDFKSVLGAKHEEEDMFGKKVWFEINAPLSGIKNMRYIAEGGLSGYLYGSIYKGRSRDEALQKFNQTTDRFKKALGSEYVFEKRETNNGDFQKFAFCSSKTAREPKASVAQVVMNKVGEQYTVDINFFHDYFGGL